MCLTLVVTILYSTIEMQLLMSSQFTFGAPVCSAKASMYIMIDLVFLTSLYMHIISLLVDSEAIVGWVCTFRQTATPSIV